MASAMQFGASLPQIKRSWAEARGVAEELDRLGFHSAWVCDHVYGVPVPNLPILEAWTELAAVAAITSKLELGTLVTPPFFRNPAILAKQVATLDHISGGRAIVGLGAGWFEAEFRGTGCAFPPLGERMKALEETAIILRRLFSDERVTFEGRHFNVSDAVCEPKPLRRRAAGLLGAPRLAAVRGGDRGRRGARARVTREGQEDLRRPHGRRARRARHLGHPRARDRLHRAAPKAGREPARDRVLRAGHARAGAAVRGEGPARVRARLSPHRFDR